MSAPICNCGCGRSDETEARYVAAMRTGRVPVRFAIAIGSALSTVRAYLPRNYSAWPIAPADGRDRVLIVGRDNAGWTLDGYVIPRLASGLHFAREVSGDTYGTTILAGFSGERS